jgi:quercetin dioxygenase-like cupin family protein
MNYFLTKLFRENTMNYYLKCFFTLVLLASLLPIVELFAQDKSSEKNLNIIAKELLKTQLEVWEDGEIIVSYVEAPAGYEIKKHYHPGEEFVYVMEGSGTAWFEDMPELIVNKGEILKIPLKAVHTMFPGPNGIKVLVFRVHKEGEPLRINVE